MREPVQVATLVNRANNGDQEAWNAIVDRYAPLVWSICRRFRLADADAGDATQTVWLRLVEQLPRLRDPAALPGWLVTTTRNECLRLTSAGRREVLYAGSLEVVADEESTALDRDLLATERRAVVREAFLQLPPHCQKLLALLVKVPPLSYAETAEKLEMAIGSIGPTRSRCLTRLRDCPVIATLESAAESIGGGGLHV